MIGIRVATTTWPRVEEMLMQGATAVLPIGAACKEHGRHLPMNTDQRQAEWISDRLIERLAVVAWPVVTYGYYPVFVEYPGSISLSQQTFSALIADVCDGIELAGATHIAIVNTGISTIAPLEACLSTRTNPSRYQLINVYSGQKFSHEVAQLEEQAWGGHADEIETSIMLAIDEAVVNLALACAAPERIVRGQFNRREPSLPNYSPDGINGDPTLATRWKGERLLSAIIDDVLWAISQPR